MITCRNCGSDDIALQASKPLETDIKYRILVWVCTFFCHTCGQEFEKDLDDEDRKEYL
jgi:DNA-directed RNA polymerase subunit RPC12/RpoP